MTRWAAILLAALATSPGAFADDSLVPTDLHSHGDCVGPRILASTNAVQSRIDHQYCVSQNSGDASRIQACLRNTARREDVTFFRDSCGSDTGPYQISLGGVEYTLERIRPLDARRVPVAGVYRAGDLRVTIEAGKLLRRSRATLDEGGDEEVEVWVTAARGTSTHRFRGVWWQGH